MYGDPKIYDRLGSLQQLQSSALPGLQQLMKKGLSSAASSGDYFQLPEYEIGHDSVPAGLHFALLF